ncbi:hypothetical protein [Halalkalibacter oceani]|uniref:hypothetical protein n=1 Tax=Halalkalibacter oceani TaxID=1653776 RepID=UPI0033992361
MFGKGLLVISLLLSALFAPLPASIQDVTDKQDLPFLYLTADIDPSCDLSSPSPPLKKKKLEESTLQSGEQQVLPDGDWFSSAIQLIKTKALLLTVKFQSTFISSLFLR